MFHSRNLAEQFFNRDGNLAFNLFCIEAWRGHEHVKHGNHDLRLLFPWRVLQGHETRHQGGNEQSQRKTAVKGRSDQAIQPVIRRRISRGHVGFGLLAGLLVQFSRFIEGFFQAAGIDYLGVTQLIENCLGFA